MWPSDKAVGGFQDLLFIFCRITVYVIYISIINPENHLQLYHLVTSIYMYIMVFEHEKWLFWKNSRYARYEQQNFWLKSLPIDLCWFLCTLQEDI